MDNREKHVLREIYRIAEEYIKSNCKDIELEKYYEPCYEYNVIKNKKICKNKIFECLVISINNKGNGKARTEKKISEPDFVNDKEIKEVLCNYDYNGILCVYRGGYEKLKDTLIKKAKFRNNHNTERFAHAVYSAAQLFCGDGIIEKIKRSYNNEEKTKELIKELQNIYNMGYTLACNFLKESGYDNLVKPDVHILDTCGKILKILYFKNEKYNVIPTNDTCIEIIKNMVNVNKNKTTCYKIDKMFYLIGSNNFYLDKENEKIENIRLSKLDFFKILDKEIN